MILLLIFFSLSAVFAADDRCYVTVQCNDGFSVAVSGDLFRKLQDNSPVVLEELTRYMLDQTDLQLPTDSMSLLMLIRDMECGLLHDEKNLSARLQALNLKHHVQQPSMEGSFTNDDEVFPSIQNYPFQIKDLLAPFFYIKELGAIKLNTNEVTRIAFDHNTLRIFAMGSNAPVHEYQLKNGTFIHKEASQFNSISFFEDKAFGTKDKTLYLLKPDLSLNSTLFTWNDNVLIYACNQKAFIRQEYIPIRKKKLILSYFNNPTKEIATYERSYLRSIVPDLEGFFIQRRSAKVLFHNFYKQQSTDVKLNDDETLVASLPIMREVQGRILVIKSDKEPAKLSFLPILGLKLIMSKVVHYTLPSPLYTIHNNNVIYYDNGKIYNLSFSEHYINGIKKSFQDASNLSSMDDVVTMEE